MIVTVTHSAARCDLNDKAALSCHCSCSGIVYDLLRLIIRHLTHTIRHISLISRVRHLSDKVVSMMKLDDSQPVKEQCVCHDTPTPQIARRTSGFGCQLLTDC